MSCIQCKSVAFHEEESNPKNTFCGDRCQQRYYGLIGVQIERMDKDEEDPNIYPYFSYIGTFKVDEGNAHKLYLGSIPGIPKKEYNFRHIIDAGITTIISVTNANYNNITVAFLEKHKNIAHTRIVIVDEDTTFFTAKRLQKLKTDFDKAIIAITDGLKSGNVLIHCTAGQSRSASVVIYWMIKELGWEIDDALFYMQSHRDKVDISRFRATLQKWVNPPTESNTKRHKTTGLFTSQ